MLRRHELIKRALAATLRFIRDRRGATAVEYGLIMALIFIVMIAAVRSVADETTEVWDSVSDRVANAE